MLKSAALLPPFGSREKLSEEKKGGRGSLKEPFKKAIGVNQC